MEDLIFLKDYKDDEVSRKSLNTLMQLECGYSLEAWYKMGCWKEQYIPYSFSDGTHIIANVSIYKQDVIYKGEYKTAIRLEHILLQPQYHHKNLLEVLIACIIEDYKDLVDLIYILVDEEVAPYYPKFGFKCTGEGITYLQTDQIVKATAPILVSYECLLQKLKQYPEGIYVVNKALKFKNDSLRRSFEYNNIPNLQIYYFQQMDTYVMTQLQERTLNIIDVLSEVEVDLDTIIAGLKAVYEFDKVKVLSELSYKGSCEVLEETEERLLFVKC